MESEKTPESLPDVIARELVNSAPKWADEIHAGGHTDSEIPAEMVKRFSEAITKHLKPAAHACPNCRREMDHIRNGVRGCRSCH